MQRLSGWPEATPTSGGSVWEIEEEELGGAPEPGVPGSPVRAPATNGEGVYVAVGKKSSSMDALAWALSHAAAPPAPVYLVHVFPEVHHIPTPLGRFPKDQLSPQQVETYMSQERAKRREMLNKLMNLCQASKVEVDTLLIESDLIAKAIVDLILVLNIKMLIVGTSRSDQRKLKGGSKAEQIQKTAPQFCKVKIICNGKELMSPSPSDTTDGKSNGNVGRRRNKDLISCNCFRKKLK